jgi:GlcNAc-P-P-Und epimerase
MALNGLPVANNRKGDTILLGGSGFIGTRLSGLLVQESVPFRIGDLRESVDFPHCWTECDVRRKEALVELFRSAAAIVNLAAVHRDDVRPLSLYHETNVDGARQVCLAARETGVQKIVFTSSVAVYGSQPSSVDEEGSFAPFNEYGRTKLAAEAVYQAWADEDPMRSLVIVRPTVIFGEGNRGNVYNLIHQIASGRFFMVGKGENVKSIAYVGNIAAFLVRTLFMGPGTHIFNYVDGPDMDTRTLIDEIRRSLNLSGPTWRIPKTAALAAGYALDAVARVTGRSFPISAVRVRKFCDNTRFVANRVDQSGFVRPYSLREGLERTIEFDFPTKSQKLRQTAVGIPG